jgi:N-dimethylarginine dimethylaminohydrolase
MLWFLNEITRLNNWLRENGFVVEEIPYAEIAKQEGLLRCTTLPLIILEICREHALQRL